MLPSTTVGSSTSYQVFHPPLVGSRTSCDALLNHNVEDNLLVCIHHLLVHEPLAMLLYASVCPSFEVLHVHIHHLLVHKPPSMLPTHHCWLVSLLRSCTPTTLIVCSLVYVVSVSHLFRCPRIVTAFV